MSRNILDIERMHTGELPVPDTADQALKDELRRLDNSDREILARYPPSAVKLKILQKISAEEASGMSGGEPQQRVFRFPAANIGRIAAVAAVLCFAVLLPLGVSHISSADPGIQLARAKGNACLFVYRQNGTETERLSTGAAAAAGDVVQLSYVAAGAKYGVIISIDGNGVITRHYPDGGAVAGKLTSGREVPLPFSYKLDDAPGYERFVLFYSEKPFPVSVLASMDNGFVTAENGRDFDFTALMPRSVNVADFVLIK